MIDATKIEMYPAFVVQKAIENGINNFTSRYVAFNDAHGEALITLLKMQSYYLNGNEEQLKSSWELLNKK